MDTDRATKTATEGEQVTPSMAESPSVSSTKPSSSQNNKESPYGVGGWLGLLVIGLTMLGPAFGAGRIYNAFQRAVIKAPQLAAYAPWITYKTEAWIIFAIASAISISAGLMLYLRYRPSSVRFTIAALWLIGPVHAVAVIVAVSVTFTQQTMFAYFAGMLGSLIGTFLVAAIWTAYLLLSKRVKNTYYVKPNSMH